VQNVYFNMVKCDRKLTPVLVEVPAMFVNQSQGIMGYNWTEFDTLIPGWYYAWFTLQFTSNRIAVPDQREKLEVTIEQAYDNTANRIADLLTERRKENIIPVGTVDGANTEFTMPQWFTMFGDYQLALYKNETLLERFVDYNVDSTDIDKLGCNKIIFESDAIPQPGDALKGNYYQSDS